jgi:5-methylcytosine-specific restriction endonuclease McrA
VPEVPLCQYCLQPIDKVFDHYVVTNRLQEPRQNKWIYAHVECKKEHAK